MKPLMSVLLTGEGTSCSSLGKVHGVILFLAEPARPDPLSDGPLAAIVGFRPSLGRLCGRLVPLWGGGEQWFEPKGPLLWAQFLRISPGF